MDGRARRRISDTGEEMRDGATSEGGRVGTDASTGRGNVKETGTRKETRGGVNIAETDGSIDAEMTVGIVRLLSMPPTLMVALHRRKSPTRTEKKASEYPF